jgi:hypothetical protein
MPYESDISLERRFSKIIKAILGNCFICQDAYMDTQEATDFAIFEVQPFRVGVRLRRYTYYLRYPRQFTIRWSRPSGTRTEIEKIRDGLVDYILYGFVDDNEERIVQWFLGDLAVFRANEPEPMALYQNNPPDSRLAVYALEQFPDTFVRHFWTQQEPVYA